jgi:hypothetical protein
MVTIFGDFDNFRRTKLAFFLKNQCYDQHYQLYFESKNANFFAEFFGENIFKIITSVPDPIFQLKDRTQEVRRLRADMANANLKADKAVAERDRLEKEMEERRSAVKVNDEELEHLRSKLSDLERAQNEVLRMKDELDLKDSEIEDKIRENEVLKVPLLSGLPTYKCR